MIQWLYTVHVFQEYSSKGITTDLYIFNFVLKLRAFLSQAFLLRLTNVALAFAILLATSSLIRAFVERMQQW